MHARTRDLRCVLCVTQRTAKCTTPEGHDSQAAVVLDPCSIWAAVVVDPGDCREKGSPIEKGYCVALPDTGKTHVRALLFLGWLRGGGWWMLSGFEGLCRSRADA